MGTVRPRLLVAGDRKFPAVKQLETAQVPGVRESGVALERIFKTWEILESLLFRRPFPADEVGQQAPAGGRTEFGLCCLRAAPATRWTGAGLESGLCGFESALCHPLVSCGPWPSHVPFPGVIKIKPATQPRSLRRPASCVVSGSASSAPGEELPEVTLRDSVLCRGFSPPCDGVSELESTRTVTSTTVHGN